MFHPNCTVSLYRRIHSAGGKAVFGFPETLPGCLISQQQDQQDDSLLYLQCPEDPAPGDEVLIGQRRFTIGAVRVCSSLDGNIRICRCSFR